MGSGRVKTLLGILLAVGLSGCLKWTIVPYSAPQAQIASAAAPNATASPDASESPYPYTLPTVHKAVFHAQAPVPMAGDTLGTSAANVVSKISGTAPVNVVNANLSFGASPSTTGNINLSNGESIKIRNGANSADLNLLTVNSSNALTIGDPGMNSPNTMTLGSTFNLTVSAGNLDFTASTGNMNLAAAIVSVGNHGQMTVGTNGVGLQFVSPAAIAIGAGGTFTLSAGQYQDIAIRLTGSLGTSSAIVVVPDFPGEYLFSIDALTSSTGTLQFQNASGAACPAATIGANIVPTLAIVYVDSASTTNTLACNY
jgi:hypothetical protein